MLEIVYVCEIFMVPCTIPSSRTVLGTVIRLIIHCSHGWCLWRYQREQSIENPTRGSHCTIPRWLRAATQIPHPSSRSLRAYDSQQYDFLGDNPRGMLTQIVLLPGERFVFAKHAGASRVIFYRASHCERKNRISLTHER